MWRSRLLFHTDSVKDRTNSQHQAIGAALEKAGSGRVSVFEPVNETSGRKVA